MTDLQAKIDALPARPKMGSVRWSDAADRAAFWAEMYHAETAGTTLQSMGR